MGPVCIIYGPLKDSLKQGSKCETAIKVVLES